MPWREKFVVLRRENPRDEKGLEKSYLFVLGRYYAPSALRSVPGSLTLHLNFAGPLGLASSCGIWTRLIIWSSSSLATAASSIAGTGGTGGSVVCIGASISMSGGVGSSEILS